MKDNKDDFLRPEIESSSLDELTEKLFIRTKELEEANHKLNEYEQERKDMTANIFHDLRAPLSAIRSTIDLINSSLAKSKNDLDNSINIPAKYIGILDRRISNLEDLINDMYYFNTVENQNIPFTMNKFNLTPLVEEFFCDLTVNSLYEERHLSLEADAATSYYVNIDIQKFLRVLDNLCTNALKYSNTNDSITIRLYSESNKSICPFVCIDIIDTGIGISEDDLPKIFNRTYMVSDSRTPSRMNSTKSSRSGLGLSIAKVIIERMNGTISCNSTMGKGSTFHIVLPICQ